MRPLIAAEPMLRAPRPEMVSESTLTGVGGRVSGVGEGAAVCAIGVVVGDASGAGAAVASLRLPTPDPPLPGFANSELAIGTFASIFENVTFCLFGLPFTPFSTEKGRYQP